MNTKNKTVGITSTIPIEVVFAAGRRPVDLNNVFIASPNPESYIRIAESEGFPTSICAWIKGIYGAIRKHRIREVIGVSGGECSSTHALFEILEFLGLKIHAFSYPYDRDAGVLKEELKKLCAGFKVTLTEAEKMKKVLDGVRQKVRRLDELTFKENRVSGWENHLWTIQTSDFSGNYSRYEKKISHFLREAEKRGPFRGNIRLGFIGIPPICPDIYEQAERRCARIVFNEFQRQFSMPNITKNLVEQYRSYTYPYDVFFRIEDIKRQIADRRIDGLIHYIQSFCFRGIQDRLLRETIGIPILTLEFDRPARLDSRSITRMEAFIEMLREKVAQ